MSGRNPLKVIWKLVKGHVRKWLAYFWSGITISIVVNVFSTWLTTKGFDLQGTPLGLLLAFPLLSSLVLLLLLATTFMIWIGSRETASALTVSPAISMQRAVLLNLLASEYKRQHTKLMQNVEGITLTLEEQLAVVASPATHQLPATVATVAPVIHTSIIEAYDEAGGGLLVLGAPGMGKSTSLRTLALELLQRAEHDSAQPLPLIFNLTSWSEKQTSLAEWLVEQISTLHILTWQESRIWIEQHRFLFLLDGLDEVSERARFSCIEAINTFRRTSGSLLVICSRTREYKALQQRVLLALPYAVEVQPLTQQQVRAHLKRLGRGYAGVRTAFQGNTVLRDLVTTPLMLSIVIRTYREKQVRDLPLLGTPQEQQQQIFEHYVAQRLQLSRPSWRFDSREMRHWLIMLALQMQQQHVTELYLEHLQSSWLSSKRWQQLFNWSCVFGCGLMTGLVYGFLSGPVVGLLLGGTIGLVFQQGRHAIEPVEILHWSWEKVRTSKESLYGPVGGLIFGVMGGLLVGLGVGQAFGLLGGVVLGVVFSLIFLLVFGLEIEQFQTHRRLDPNQGIRASGRNALTTGLGIMVGINLLIVLAYGVSAAFSSDLMYGLLIGAVYALSFGLMYASLFGLFVGLYYGGKAYIKHYMLRFFLWRNGVLPFYTVRFLDEACERDLLKRLGSAYSFTHPLFEDFFALSADPHNDSSGLE